MLGWIWNGLDGGVLTLVCPLALFMPRIFVFECEVVCIYVMPQQSGVDFEALRNLHVNIILQHAHVGAKQAIGHTRKKQ